MATEEYKAPAMVAEVSTATGSTTSVDFRNGTAGEVDTEANKDFGLEFDREGNLIDSTAAEPESPEESTEPTTETPEAGDGGEGEAETPADLPEFDAGNEEVLRAYEDKLFTFDDEGGSALNFEGLMAEWEANALTEGAEGGSLSEGTYAALQHFTGISKDAVKEIEAGRVALREANEAALFAPVGGKEAHDDAFKWATEGSGYTAAQKQAFNEAAEKGGTALAEAIELLQVRFQKANGPDKPTPSRRPAAPRRSGTSREAAAPRADVYANGAEYEADAKTKGRHNPEVRAKLARSDYFR